MKWESAKRGLHNLITVEEIRGGPRGCRDVKVVLFGEDGSCGENVGGSGSVENGMEVWSWV